MTTHINSERPQSGKAVLVVLKDGTIHEGHYIKNANKYVQNVDRWRVYRLGKKTISPDEVAGWIEMPVMENDDCMPRNELLDTLSACIVRADEIGDPEIGDTLFQVIIELKKRWGIDLGDQA